MIEGGLYILITLGIFVLAITGTISWWWMLLPILSPLTVFLLIAILDDGLEDEFE